MEKAVQWLNEHADDRDLIFTGFADDRRLAGNALPDALVTSPELLRDLVKAWTVHAIMTDAPTEVLGELVGVLDRMRTGLDNLSGYVRQTLHNLRGMRDAREIVPIVSAALDGASEVDRAKLEAMLYAAENAALDEEPMLMKPAPGTKFSWPDCAGCCGVGCAVCTVDCLLCCVAGCVVCG